MIHRPSPSAHYAPAVWDGCSDPHPGRSGCATECIPNAQRLRAPEGSKSLIVLSAIVFLINIPICLQFSELGGNLDGLAIGIRTSSAVICRDQSGGGIVNPGYDPFPPTAPYTARGPGAARRFRAGCYPIR